jgi:digeranylgeranylglycerophospholipid reductase
MNPKLPDRTEILVVGAGIAGAVAAATAARAARRVVLVDRLAAPDVGRKICGNALAEDGLAAASEYTSPPAGPEVARAVTSGLLVLQDGVTTLPIPKSGVVLNRLLFGQRLLADALEAGATLVDRTTCAGWHDRSARRVALRTDDGGQTVIEARIVIDASGYRSVLTRSGGPLRPDPLDRSDVAIGYREIVPVAPLLDEPDTAVIALGPEGARAGYAWVFPMGERLANVGIGAPLDTVGAGADLRSAYRRFVESRPKLSTSAALDAGVGLLPLRRPLATFVGEGFLCAGDAASQTNPLHGGGIAPAIIGGGMAGRSAAAALEDGGDGVEALWGYNGDFMREAGARHAGHAFLRRLLYSLSDEDFDFLTLELAGAGVMLRTLVAGGARLPLREVLRVLARFAKKPALAAMIVRGGRLVEQVQNLYYDYPASPAQLDAWTGHVAHLVKALRRLTARREA